MSKTLEEAKLISANITMAFEGGGGYSNITGNFDDAILSAGFLQWNLGSKTLQPLIKAYHKRNPELFTKCCTVYVNVYKKKVDLSKPLLIVCDAPVEAARAYFTDPSRQDPKKHKLASHWQELFTNLGKEPEFQAVQREFAKPYMDRAIAYCKKYKFVTERSVALMFDICVQMGQPTAASKARYHLATFGRVITERQRLKKMAEAVIPQAGKWGADVRSRKFTIVDGVGTVHGRKYNLETEFGLSDAQVL